MKTIGFFSCDSHTGCTTVAAAVARELSARGNRTLFIAASGKLSLAYTSRDICHSIDDMRAAVISGKLSSEELHQVAEIDGSLEIIGDVRNTFTAKIFPIDTFEKIKQAAEDYSYVVVDAGNRMELALNISALQESDDIYLVITQSPVTLYRFREIDDYILKQMQCSYKVILNRFSKDIAHYRKAEIEAMIERKIDYVIGETEYGIHAELERKNALVTKGGKKILNEITNGILQDYPEARSRGIFARGLFGKTKEKHSR